jgi:hypothetical protein
VGRDDEPPPGEEVLDLGVLDERAKERADGEQEPTGSARRGPSRRALLTAGGLTVVAGGFALAASRRGSAPPTASEPRPSASVTRSPSVTARPSPSPSPPVAVTDLGRRLLGVTAGWDLFALGDDVLVRVHPASGRVTRTSLPPLGDGGVSLVPARGRLLIHPPDFRQGYVVVDDRPVTEIPPRLGGDGPLLPGPDPDHVWTQSFPGRMSLVTLTGDAAGLALTVPPYLGTALADGRGYVLFQSVGGVYQGDRDGIRRLTTGGLVAVGPRGIVTVDCDDHGNCSTVLHGHDGRTTIVPAELPVQGGPSGGAISPDGRTLVLYVYGQSGDVSATLVDLGNGATRAVPLSLTPTGEDGTIVWSPDSRWIFAIDALSQLKVIDARTLAVADLVPGLPSLGQLAIRV